VISWFQSSLSNGLNLYGLHPGAGKGMEMGGPMGGAAMSPEKIVFQLEKFFPSAGFVYRFE
jgi:hypothetical protein